MKVINRSQQGSSSLQRLFLEVQSMKALNYNPRVVRLPEVTGTTEGLNLVMSALAKDRCLFTYCMVLA